MSSENFEKHPSPAIDPRLLLEKLPELPVPQQIDTLETVHEELVKNLMRTQV